MNAMVDQVNKLRGWSQLTGTQQQHYRDLEKQKAYNAEPMNNGYRINDNDYSRTITDEPEMNKTISQQLISTNSS